MTAPADGTTTTGRHATSQPALGFLTILEHEQHGLVGGYLVLNTVGRPLEFHCTAPLKANRAQQILFGPTLEPYLYGEQIGQTLLGKSALEILTVCTDVERALCVGDYVGHPIALVLPGGATPSPSTDQGSEAGVEETPPRPAPEIGESGHQSAPPSNSSWRVETARRAGGHLAQFTIGSNRLAVPAHRPSDQSLIVERLQGVAPFDLAEPFERIRQAVEEAHKTGRAAAA